MFGVDVARPKEVAPTRPFALVCLRRVRRKVFRAVFLIFLPTFETQARGQGAGLGERQEIASSLPVSWFWSVRHGFRALSCRPSRRPPPEESSRLVSLIRKSTKIFREGTKKLAFRVLIGY